MSKPPWSELQYEIGDIPYAADFRDVDPIKMTLGDYLKLQLANKTESQYWFSEHAPIGDNTKDDRIHEFQTARALEELRMAMQEALGHDGAGLDKMGEVTGVQFIVGPAKTGAPIHFHGTAINLVLKGAKRWFVRPSSRAYWSNANIYSWYNIKNRPAMIECLQRPGDLIVVPESYTHGVLNVDSSVAVSWLIDTSAAHWHDRVIRDEV